MSTTDQQLFSEIQFQMLEAVQDGGATWTSGLWTAQEVLDYANQRQYRFMKDTLLMMAYARIDHAIGVGTGALPPDWIVTYRADWKNTTTLKVTELARSSQWEMDHSKPDWAVVSVPRPLAFSDAESVTLTYLVMPIPSVAGQVMLLYVSLTAVLTGLGEIFTVPDEYIPAIKYGIMSDMLRKVGRGQDIERADYCEMRFEEGVEAAKMILAGGVSED
jgi:hypothetical protein